MVSPRPRHITALAILASLASVACESPVSNAIAPVKSAPEFTAGPPTGGPPPIDPTCTPQSIVSEFNGTTIQTGTTIWFNQHLQIKGPVVDGTTFEVYGSSIIVAGYTVGGPRGLIKFSSSVSVPTSSYNAVTNRWTTLVPVGYSKNIFLTGIPWAAPAPLTGVKNVTWTNEFFTNTAGVTAQWQWSAAAYSVSFTNGDVQVKPVDDATSQFNNSDHAGTPENFRSYVIGGARGGGGSDYTGSWSATLSPVTCPH